MMMMMIIKTFKRHILGRGRTISAIMVKICPGVRAGRDPEKSITRTVQDNNKTQTRNISHIWGKLHVKQLQ